MMKFASGRTIFGCEDSECSILIHKVVLITEVTNKIGTVFAEFPLHKRQNGTYYINVPGGVMELPRD